MEKLLFAITVTFLITSCSKLKIFNFNSNDSSAVENDKEEPKSPFDVDDSEYKVYGNLRPCYELGFDNNNHAFLTDTRNNIQIVFMCDGYGYYAKEDFLTHYDEAIAENRDLKEAFSYVIEWCVEQAFKQDSVWSDHFNCNITRYFVSYHDAYGLFHI